MSETPSLIPSSRKQESEKWGEDLQISIEDRRGRKRQVETDMRKETNQTKRGTKRFQQQDTEVEIEEAEMCGKTGNEKANKVGRQSVQGPLESPLDYWIVQALLLS